jgi:MFS family permease
MHLHRTGSGNAVARAPVRLQDWFRRDIERPIEDRLGGRARTIVVGLLACVLALDTADTATVGAAAGSLENALGIGNTQIGLLVAVSTGIGAIATLPMGALVDRVTRTRVLWIAILIWGLAMAVSGASVSFLMLLLSRLALGAVVAAATPAVASLVGDFFPAAERGVIYGYILLGELIGAGIGYLVGGTIAGPLSWRYSFWILAVPALFLAWGIYRLPEPARGGSARMPAGTEHVPGPEGLEHPADEGQDQEGAEQEDEEEQDEGEVAEEITEQGITPHEHLVLTSDPSGRSLWWAVRYVLSVRTNLFLIGASALGYFYYKGLLTFAVVYLRGRFGLGQSVGSLLFIAIAIGALAGVLISGRSADQLIHRGYIPARVLVAGISFLVAAVLFVPALFVGVLAAAIPLLFLAAAGLGGVNPPLDAARLDVMHPRLWGRAESVRTVLRRDFEAIAPLLFGYVSSLFGPSTAGLGQPNGASQAGSHGLEYTFLIMLVTLAAAGGLLAWGRLTYSRDTATAIASAENTENTEPEQPDAPNPSTG